jgi:hypothetical protein
MNYVLNLATAFIAAFQLAKDWGAHQATWRRAAVLSLIVTLGVGGTINTYYAGKKASAVHEEDQRQIGGLKKAVETANKAQDSNTAQFLQSFSTLTQKLSDLQTQVKTSGLQKEAARLRAELEATQKALTPQRAELVSSLGNVTDTLENLGVTESSVPRGIDGTISFTATVVNKSPVQATNGSIFLRICEQCTFADEPKRFMKPVGAPDYDRQMMFATIPATTGIAVPLKIKTPDRTHRLEIQFVLRCENCTVHPPELLHINY